ncbi:MAG TPA: hypothetical protein VN048_02790 [Verrucomicrobiae bacterium]|nr:hypothetical protein [Verrucomicrobiae bacterium]
MKKLILLGLIAMGIGAAGASAQAGGFAVVVNPFPFRVPAFLPPPPIFAPAAFFSGGCAGPVVVRGGDCGPYYRGGWYGRYDRHDRFEHRDYGRHEGHSRHDR